MRPRNVALIRGAIEAVVLALLTALVTLLTSTDVPAAYQAFVPVGVVLLRTLEGIADERIDPTVDRTPEN